MTQWQETKMQATKRPRKKISSMPKPISLGEFISQLPTIKLSKLPVGLSSFAGKKPENICQIESSEKGTGFNAFAWREQISSKLYSSKLCLENLDSVGMINERLRVTLYPEVQILANESHWENNLPDTIVVKSVGSKVVMMAAKKMVLGLLDSYQSDLKLPNKPILKETKTDNPGAEFAIEFSVKGITQIEPIMSPNSLVISDKRLAKILHTALTLYQGKLSAGVVNGFRVEEVAATPNSKMFEEIKVAAESLQETINAEIDSKEQTKLTPNDLAALSRLQTQVESAIEDGFKNEFDTRRWQQWRALNPRTEDEIVPGTGKEIGAGLQGPVFRYELDPALRRRPVVLKYDNFAFNSDADVAGIPMLNPQQSVRAVAAYNISEKLGLGVIPRTECFVGTDENGRPKLGQTMEFVTGAIGQRTVGKKNNVNVDQWEIQQYENRVKNPFEPSKFDLAYAQDMLRRHVKVNGTWYEAQIFPVDIKYDSGFVQKGLSDLQVFDCIIGHADRNAGNWIYEKDKDDNIIGVKGIDNDDTFGEKWARLNPKATMFRDRGSKTPGIPPIVDISTALSILKTDVKDILLSLGGLSDDEKAAAAVRFAHVQQEVRQRVKEGKIASIAPIGDKGDQDKLQQLRAKVPDMVAMPDSPRWGDPGIAAVHNEQNSYLGIQLAQKKQFGVIPERGDALI